jgi:hypothetical protein
MFSRCASLLLLLPLSIAQDPVPPSRPTPPPGAEQTVLPPVPDPPLSAIERRDLNQRFAPSTGLEGIYELRAVVRPGMPRVAGVRGYLFVGRRLLALYIHADGDDPKRPHLQTGVRRYQVAGSRLKMSTLVGHRNNDDGDILLEPPEWAEDRQFLLVGTVLRVFQDPTSYMEFVRVE